MAVRWVKTDLVNKLIELGADVNTPGYRGITPLMMAALIGSQDMVQLLLTIGADPHAVSSKGKDAEQIARSRGYVAIAEQIKEVKLSVQPQPSFTSKTEEPFKIG